MYRFLLKPKWLVFHLLCLAGVVGMLAAASWQWTRYQDHNDFKTEVQHRTESPTATFEQVMAEGPPAAVEWRLVTATGTYAPGPGFEVVNLSQGGEGGHDAVNGLVLSDGSVLMVNRGFAVATAPLPTAPSGAVTVTGRIRQGQVAGTGQQADDGTQQLTQIRRVDLGALSKQFDQKVQPVYLDMLESDPKEPALTPVAFPDLDGGPPHLSYTFQWLIFTVCVMVGWVLAVRKSVNDRKGKPKKRPKTPPIADDYVPI
jgi:cytochrome oxidase assembly protein ShyY1